MKVWQYITALLALVALSCTEKAILPTEPEVDNGPLTMLSVVVEQPTFDGVEAKAFEWSASDYIGVYGSNRGENMRYVPLEGVDDLGRKVFYGEAVEGTLKIYYPYSEEGNAKLVANRFEVPAEQQYFASPYHHLRNNLQMVATTTTEEVRFGYNCGVLKVVLMLNAADVEQVEVTALNLSEEQTANLVGDVAISAEVTPAIEGGASSVVLKGIGAQSASEQTPLVLWAAVADGTYDNFMVTVSSESASKNILVKGPFTVEKSKACTVEVRDVKYDHGIGDFNPKPGEFEDLDQSQQ